MNDDLRKLSFQLRTTRGRVEVRAASEEGEERFESPAPSPSLYESVAAESVSAPDPSLLQFVGRELHRCVLEPSALARQSLADAAAQQAPLHIEFRFDPDQVSLARMPWELLTDDQGRALELYDLAHITRYIAYPEPPPVLLPNAGANPLLQLVTRPTDYPPLSPRALTWPAGVVMLEHATLEQFERKLLIERTPAWGMHFDGHGGVVLVCKCGAFLDRALLAAADGKCPQCGAPAKKARLTGVLAFEQDGLARLVTTEEVGGVLHNSRINFVMLLACESAAVGGVSVFSGLAPGLILGGVPAVVGMQYEVDDGFATRFVKCFYDTLLDDVKRGGAPDLVRAMGLARRLTANAGPWYSPVLYLRQHKVAEPAPKTVYQTRTVDAAAPGEVAAGEPFLARLWIRRPTTPQLDAPQLRASLGLVAGAPVASRSAAVDLGFEPVAGRQLRRGKVRVRLSAPRGTVEPAAIDLFVDEALDAPAAIFTVTPRATGPLPLTFNLSQELADIATLQLTIRAAAQVDGAGQEVSRRSIEVPVTDGPIPDGVPGPASGETGSGYVGPQPPPRPGDTVIISRRDEDEMVYLRARLLMSREHWDEAATVLTELDRQKPGYRDVATLLRQCEEEIELAKLYEQLTDDRGKRNWQQVVQGSADILRRRADYRDVRAIAEEARRELARSAESAAAAGSGRTEPRGDFAAADRRYAELKRRYDAKELTVEEFDKALRDVMVQDAAGRWWAKARETGDWNYYDRAAGAWVKAQPAASAEVPDASDKAPRGGEPHGAPVAPSHAGVEVGPEATPPMRAPRVGWLVPALGLLVLVVLIFILWRVFG